MSLGQRSPAWYYFETLPDDKTRHRCKVCENAIVSRINTTNLFNHLKGKHPTVYKEAKRRLSLKKGENKGLEGKSFEYNTYTPPPRKKKGRPSKSTTQSAKTAVIKSVTSVVRNDSAPLTKELSIPDKAKQVKTTTLLKMISVDLHPISIVNEVNFREFVHTLDPHFELPTKKVITKTLLPVLAKETQSNIKLDVDKAPFLALSVELWSYLESKSFVTLTAHFIKDSWEMSNIALDTFDCTEEMTETSIASSFKRITDQWGISDRVFTIISNTSDKIISSAALINGWKVLTCFGNSLNLLVENAITSVSELKEAQSKVINIATYFEHNIRAQKTLVTIQQQQNLPAHKLKQKNPRLWTSMLFMFERMIEQAEAVNTVLHFMRKDHLCLSDGDVELIKSFVDILTPFEAATKELCTDHYTCVSKVIPIATLLQKVMSTDISTDLGPQKTLKNALVFQMQSALSNLETNSKLAIATLLDPRFKQHAFMDSLALELAQKQLVLETASIVQNLPTQNTDNSLMKTKKKHSSLWNFFDKKVIEAGAMKSSTSDAENECRRYFNEDNIPRNQSALNWWKDNEANFPLLKSLAQKYLAIPATSVSSNLLYTKQGDQVSVRRDHIKPDYINTMVLLSNNLQIKI